MKPALKYFRFDALLLQQGWLRPGYVGVNEDGKIKYLADQPAADAFAVEIVRGIALPGFSNAHSHAFQFGMAGMAEKHLPGSWLPYGSEMITNTAAPYFKVVTMSSGKLDYIETISQWRRMIRSFSFKKYRLYAKFLMQLISDRTFMHMIDVFRISPIKVCFERGIMDHYRIVFEKI